MIVLIVEDNERMRQTVRSFVGDLADEIYECDDGAEALAAYDEHHPDWVLMDVQMRDVDGITATREIKTAHPEARIAIVSGYDDVELREAADLAGACAYVLKEEMLDLRLLLTSEESERSLSP